MILSVVIPCYNEEAALPHYLSKTYLEAKGRPIYIAAEQSLPGEKER